MKAVLLIIDDEKMCTNAIRLLLNQVLDKHNVKHELIIFNDKQENQKAQAILSNIPFLFEFDSAPLIEKLSFDDIMIKDIKVVSHQKNDIKNYQKSKKDQYFKEKNLKVVKTNRTTKK